MGIILYDSNNTFELLSTNEYKSGLLYLFCSVFFTTFSITNLLFVAIKVYNKYQGPKIVAPFHLLLVLKNLDEFKM